MSARVVILVLVSAVFASPTPAIPRSEAVPRGLLGQALICFYRGLDWGSQWEPYAVRVHDEKVGGLARGSFLYHLTAPGRRIVFVEADINVSRSFRLRSGEIYYIRVDRRGGPLLSRPTLLLVEPAKGVRELSKLSYSGPELSHIARQYCLRNDPLRDNRRKGN
jgi:hypothetical protein